MFVVEVNERTCVNPSDAKADLEEKNDPFGLRNVIHDIPNDYQSKHEGHLQIDLNHCESCVVDCHATLHHANAVEFGHCRDDR